MTSDPLKNNFSNKRLPRNLVDKCFKIPKFFYSFCKKLLLLVIRNLGNTSLKTRSNSIKKTQCKKPIKGIINCCKLQAMLKIQFKLPIKQHHFSNPYARCCVQEMNRITENVLDDLLSDMINILFSHL